VQEFENELLVAMWRKYFADEARYDTVQWVKDKFAENKDLNPQELRMMADGLEKHGFTRKTMGSNVTITQKGINRVESTEGLLDPKEKEKVFSRRRDILKAIKAAQESSPQGTAQFGRVMELTRLSRNDCGPHMRLAEERGSIITATAGFFKLTEMGEYEIEALENLYPTVVKQPEAPSGPVNLASINFFGD